MKKRVRLIALLVLAIIAAALLWKFVSWATLSAKYEAFSISDLPPVWYYSSVILLAVLLMVVIWFVLQIIPKRQAQALQTPQKKVVVEGQEIDEEGSIYISQSSIKPTELFSIENEARKTLSQIIGGFLVIVSVILTGANLAITQGQAEKNRSLALEGQITDRFTKAIAQLGDTKLEVRLGGIYALERIAKDSEKDHSTIMKVLSAFVRENAPVKKPETSSKASSIKKSANKEELLTTMPATDIQAILAVISGRKADGENHRIDLGITALRSANFSGANLRGVSLFRADLRWAVFIGADLRGVLFLLADLSGADLSEADLSGANLYAARLRAQLIGAKLNNTDLSQADLKGAILSKADLSGAKNLTWEQISKAIIDDDTTLPPEIENQHKDELKAMREKTRKERENM